MTEVVQGAPPVNVWKQDNGNKTNHHLTPETVSQSQNLPFSVLRRRRCHAVTEVDEDVPICNYLI